MITICEICGNPHSSFEQYDPHTCISKSALKKEINRLNGILESITSLVVVWGDEPDFKQRLMLLLSIDEDGNRVDSPSIGTFG